MRAILEKQLRRLALNTHDVVAGVGDGSGGGGGGSSWEPGVGRLGIAGIGNGSSWGAVPGGAATAWGLVPPARVGEFSKSWILFFLTFL